MLHIFIYIKLKRGFICFNDSSTRTWVSLCINSQQQVHNCSSTGTKKQNMKRAQTLTTDMKYPVLHKSVYSNIEFHLPVSTNIYHSAFNIIRLKVSSVHSNWSAGFRHAITSSSPLVPGNCPLSRLEQLQGAWKGRWVAGLLVQRWSLGESLGQELDAYAAWTLGKVFIVCLLSLICVF